MKFGLVDWQLLTAALNFVAGIGLLTGYLATRKGYSFWTWVFAGGIIGLGALAFLPVANDSKLPDYEKRRLAEQGNQIGKKLIAVALICVFLRFVMSV